MIEKWKKYPIDSRYEISNLGRVRNSKTKRVRKASNAGKGYLSVVFSTPDGHVGRYIHRMVIETYFGSIPDDMTVSHLNGDRKDNRLDNLTVESLLDNLARKKQHGTCNSGVRNGGCKLSLQQVDRIRDFGASGMVQEDIAKLFPISRSQVGRILRNQNWM